MRPDFSLCMYFRAALSEPMEARHHEVVTNMQTIESPVGWRNVPAPPMPEFGIESVALYSVRYPQAPKTKCSGLYHIRAEGFMYEDQSCDDNLVIDVDRTSASNDYRDILHNQFPRMTRAFRAYCSRASFGSYAVKYEGGVYYANETYNNLKNDKSIDINGRNNIFALEPAMYWDARLCKLALGYDRDEVIRRLQGKVPLVMPLMDGVYTVFNDDPDLSYEEFVAINDRFKPILGLI